MNEGDDGAATAREEGGVTETVVTRIFLSVDQTGSDLLVVATRELRTIARTPALLALSAAFVVSVAGVAWAGTGGGGGFVPLTLDLLTFVEVLVPLLAVAFGYRSILGDRETGELDVLRTFDVSRTAYVGGVYLGRALALVSLILGTLLAVGLLVPFLTADIPTFLAINAAADSGVRYVRFVALAAGFTLTVLAATVAISAAARTARTAFALAAALAAALVLGIDTALVAGLAGGVIPESGLPTLLALSPNSAFRSLVLSTAVGVLGGAEVAAGNPLANAIGLGLWWLGSLGIAVWQVWPAVDNRDGE
ncbi:ABC transporter permease [Halobellus clavatus]|uniref:ABC-2 type transport system permease protein n=1 Tax=Halobellus clavatus TaxID=660517 RepID=A0A1H3FAG2_9EURY|nr:ABC transporter permease subunit [Halobellus clavatus]SDX87986.1 ABC-2 type transport system permease protein [Halobellus clavatus]